MVATSKVAARIERSLDVLLSELADQPEIAQQWDDWTQYQQLDYSLMWDHLMADYLTELDQFYWDRAMSAEQEKRYLRLLDKLKAAMPTIERLNLYRPPVVLEI